MKQHYHKAKRDDGRFCLIDILTGAYLLILSANSVVIKEVGSGLL